MKQASPERRLSRISQYAGEMGQKKLHELLVPVIKSYQKWIGELASLALSFDEDEDENI